MQFATEKKTAKYNNNLHSSEEDKRIYKAQRKKKNNWGQQHHHPPNPLYVCRNETENIQKEKNTKTSNKQSYKVIIAHRNCCAYNYIRKKRRI